MDEQWASLDHMGFSNYKISTYGRVINIRNRRELKGSLNGGYKRINLKNKRYMVHRLVAKTFIRCDNTSGLTIDHIDQNKLNNHVDNLRWATAREQGLNQTRKNRICRAVYQYDANGILIKKWDSVKEAATFLGVSDTSVNQCCNNSKRKCKGFKWRYAVDVDIDPNEEWKHVDGFDNTYASTLGRIRLPSGKITCGTLNAYYLQVTAKDIHGKYRSVRVHRLVAIAFHGYKDELCVNHINGDKLDNRPENLEWITNAENIKHAYDTGLIDKTKTYRSVLCLHRDSGIIVKQYDSIANAASETGVRVSDISNVCRGRQYTAGGYRWQYAD